MKKHLILLVSFALLLSAAFGATGRYRLSWRDDPTTTMVIGWHQNGGSNPMVAYGTQDLGQNFDAYPQKIAPARQVTVKGLDTRFARLTGLQPDTVYYFVVKDSTSTSSRMSFKTAPASTKPFTFIAGGDSRNNATVRQNANRLVAKLRPLFVLFGGDYTKDDTSAQWNEWLDNWQLTRSSDGRMYPIVGQRGNHDSSDVANIFDMPNANAYYALSIVPNYLRVYTLNTEITPGGTQGSWLVNDLENNQNVQWKIVSYHRETVPTTTTKVAQADQFDAWCKPFYTYAVSLVVESDSHLAKVTWPLKPNSSIGFTRNDATGTVYIGSGCWGAPLRADDKKSSWIRNSGSFNMFHLQHVYSDRIESRVVRIGTDVSNVGTVSDSNPLALPANLDIWNPSNGSVVVINPPGNQIQKVTAPALSPAPGTYPEPGVSVTLSTTTAGATIRYTTDGSTPSATVGAVYSGAINVSTDTTIKAIAYKSGMTNSDVTSGSYTISSTPPPVRYYKIKLLANPNLVIASSANNPINGTQLIVATDNGSNAQQWEVTDVGSDYVKITSRLNPNMCIDCSATPGKGTKVQLWAYEGNTRQQWVRSEVAPDHEKISVRANTSYVLDCADVNPVNGSKVQTWSFTSGNQRQLWIFEEVTP